MMGDQRRLSLKARLGIAALALTILTSAASGGLVAIQSVEGIGFVEALAGRAIVRTIHEKRAEKADRKAINQRRDEEKAQVDQEQQVRDYQFIRGWLDERTWVVETVRLAVLKKGIDERAKRERQVVSFQTRRNIRNDLAGTVEDVLTVSTGMNPKAVRFAGNLLRGEKPITAALDALAARGREVVDPREQFRELRKTLSEVEEGLKSLRGAKGISVRVELTRLVREITGPDRTPEEAEEAIQRARQLAADVEKAVAQAGAIKKDLFPQSPGIDPKRFAKDVKWIVLNDIVQEVDTSDAGKAVLAGILRKVGEQAAALLAARGITLTDEQLIQIGIEIASKKYAAGVQGDKVNIDEIVRQVVNEQLALAGLPPLGAETPTPEPEGEVEPEPEDTPTPEPEGEVEPEPEETPTPEPQEEVEPEATETPTPEPEEEVEPEPTETSTPTPEATPTPTPEPTEGHTAEGTYTYTYGTVKENWIWLNFNPAGGAVTGEGYVRFEDVPSPECGPGIDESRFHYTGTYDAASKTFKGTYDIESGGFNEAPVCDEHGCTCEVFPREGVTEDFPWEATLEDGVVRSTVGAGFRLTVKGQ